ncbi:sigma-70 family RNA polymerase sigma factor [uncultured Dokdonia sp.]|uniref:RNA polymerase sigma factor n=1 Tax=uncultured Dokdonia sp. TaxID=575653 RepID=UPI0026069F02|nr:sigma-70 family RNA polymerase sigma factor [uncultured Dokdonia sp.]
MVKNNKVNFLEGLRTGDEDIIKAIYIAMFPKVRHFVLKNEGTQQDTDEVFQNALYQLSVRLKVSEIEIKSSFEAYLFTVCKNLWRKELNSKKRWVRNEEVIALKSEESNHSEAIIAQERWDLFEEKLELLSPNCKDLLKDYFKKVSYDRIVKKFKYASENVAFQRIFKCKKRLGDLIMKDSNYAKLKS